VLICFGLANDEVQQRGRLAGLHALESRQAGPGCCNGWFGPGQLLIATFILRLVNILNRNEKIGLVQTVIKPKV